MQIACRGFSDAVDGCFQGWRFGPASERSSLNRGYNEHNDICPNVINFVSNV